MTLIRIILFCAFTLSLAVNAEPVGYPVQLSDEVTSSDRYMGIQLKGMLSLKGSPLLAELSGLAWDEDEQILYGVTDRGLLLHLSPSFTNGLLTGMELLGHFPLLEKSGAVTKGKRQDSEGITVEQGNNGIAGDSRLLISFERDKRIVRYRPDASYIEQIPLPPDMKKSKYRSKSNKGLEGVTQHPDYGIITANERLRKGDSNTLFSTGGKRWSYPTESPYDSLVALERLPDNGLLLLRRAYKNMLSPLIITLSRVTPEALAGGKTLALEEVAQFDTTRGWRTQNFEGLTRHQGNAYFIASDDNGIALGRTQVIYFELIE